jgi:TRAP-type C4-dicarboxylate transport system substrate-binding protein
MITTRHITTLALALVAAFGAGCSTDDEGTKAGGGDAPVTLRIGADDFQGRPASDQMEQFAARVRTLSGGEVRVKPVFHAAGNGPDWDQRVARMVTSGELDMGMIPSRSWDTEGVTSLRALNAPFLVTTDELTADVVSGELADELMSGLDEAGVVGLALVPEGMRHPFGLKKPLLGPADYEGQRIRTPTSDTAAAVFAALGARADDQEVDENRHAGVDSSYVLDAPGIPTGNVTFYPKVNSLVINEKAYQELDESQQEVLAKAAAETRDWAIANNPTDADGAEGYCENGAGVALATDAQLAALERATRPVYTELARDEQTREIIAAIRELAAETPVSDDAVPVACESRAGGAADAGAGTDAGPTPGVYRYEVTEAHMREAGVTDPGKIAESIGVITGTIADGEYCWEQRGPTPAAQSEMCNPYVVDGGLIRFEYPAGQPDVYRWRQLPNGDLKLAFVSAEPGEEGVARANGIPVWKWIGDAK